MTGPSERDVHHLTQHAPAHDTRPWIDHAAARSGNALWLLGRILIGSIFVQSGLDKLMSLDGFTGFLVNSGIPAGMASILAPVGASVEFAGGLAIVLGLMTRYVALLLIVFVIIATLLAHRFWDYDGSARYGQLINFSKNVAIIGGFLFVFVSGGGRYSLDRWWQREHRAHHHPI
jgi:putative oxidoreductase